MLGESLHLFSRLHLGRISYFFLFVTDEHSVIWALACNLNWSSPDLLNENWGAIIEGRWTALYREEWAHRWLPKRHWFASAIPGVSIIQWLLMFSWPTPQLRYAGWRSNLWSIRHAPSFPKAFLKPQKLKIKNENRCWKESSVSQAGTHLDLPYEDLMSQNFFPP